MAGKFVQGLSKSVACLMVLAGLTAAHGDDQYRVVRLVPNHGESGLPRAINSSGQAVGGSGEAHGGDHAAFVAQRGGRAMRLPALPQGDYSEAFGINDAGLIVGSSNTASTLRAVRWSSTNVTALPLPNGMTASEALAVNNLGAIAGYVSGPAGMQAAVWNPDGSLRVLRNPEAGQLSQATAINSRGDVAGRIVEDGVSRAFLWSSTGVLTVLPGGQASNAHGINDLGYVAGSCNGDEGERACLWTPEGVQNLGTLFNGDHGEAFDVNNAGTVVGSGGTSLGLRAFVWTRADGMRDLNSLIPPSSRIVLSVAVSISERGEILAFGSINHDLEQDRRVDLDHGGHSGPTFVFLLTPTR